MNLLSLLVRPKKSVSIEELAMQVGELRGRVKSLEIDAEDRHDVIMKQLKRINGRYTMQDRRASAKQEEQEIQAALMEAGIDLASPDAMQNPQELIQKAMQNPALMQLVMKKLGSELL